ncbi:MAG: hypothetical protein PHC28_05545 [Flavobacterium sp.]|uniref:hypothetical protein n=1 Tax=Flavobacterium sp. TaxID=239 RepID=UPI00263769C3|nr:hypothetical protein [Flavobacterium sp.]MDD5149932.1 hypothetical protein [Flavobacterium sp.]
MKNLGLLFLSLTCIAFVSCKKNQSQPVEGVPQVQAEMPISKQCYKAIYEQDTVDLEVSTLKDGAITGNMEMKVFNMPNKVGKIAGEFRGDTLFASYTFIQGTNDKITYKNPMAFLKKGEELILGNGKIENNMGASYFVKDTPIEFEQVKYKFSKVDCIDK